MSIQIKVRGAVGAGEVSLCRSCRCGHIRRGFRESEEATFCGFGGELRAVTFKVADCTDFADRSVPFRFELEKMALLIDVPRTRKNAGFNRNPGFAPAKEKA